MRLVIFGCTFRVRSCRPTCSLQTVVGEVEAAPLRRLCAEYRSLLFATGTGKQDIANCSPQLGAFCAVPKMSRLLPSLLVGSLSIVLGQTANTYGHPICSAAQVADATKGIQLMSASCQSAMGAALASSTAPSDYGLQCPCFCELTHAQFYGFPTTPNCATSTSADMTIEEHWIFCNYGHCPCASAPRSSSTGGSYCKCSDAAQMNGHVPGTACKAPLSCTSNNNCPGSMRCSTSPSRRRKMTPLGKMAARKKGEGRQLFGASSVSSGSVSGTCV